MFIYKLISTCENALVAGVLHQLTKLGQLRNCVSWRLLPACKRIDKLHVRIVQQVQIYVQFIDRISRVLERFHSIFFTWL